MTSCSEISRGRPPSEDALRCAAEKTTHFLRRLQKPTPALPLHIFAAEGETAGNRSFPDVIVRGQLCSLGDTRELAQEGRKGWVGIDVALPKGARFFPKGGEAGLGVA